MLSERQMYFKEYIIPTKTTVLKKQQTEKEFLIYLDKEGILQELQLTVIHYEKTVNSSLRKKTFTPPFRFQLKLDLMKLQEISVFGLENLHHLFIKEPDTGKNLAENVILCGLEILTNVKLKKSDLQIIPLVINLPVTCEIYDFLQCPSLGLECIQGVLTSKTSIAKYMRSSVCSCRYEHCPKNQWQRYPENFGKTCPDCQNLMEEDVLSADMGEEIICQIMSLQAYESSGRFQALNVRVKDELCFLTNFVIGEKYAVTGKLTGNFFEALNILLIQSRPEMNLSSDILPKSIVDLYCAVCAITPSCPWSFVYALSSTLGSHLIPVSSHLHLKTGLILGLSTQKSDESPAPLVAIGPDSVNTQYLFHMAGKLAPRYIRRSIAHSYLGGASKPGLQTDLIRFEAGQLILASNGVCDLGDWSKFKKEQANYICQTIESSQIILNKGDKGKTNLTDFVKLKCSVWTYWCHITTSRNHQLQLKTLINVFGIPFLAEEKNEFEVKKICWKNLRGKQIYDSILNAIPLSDLKEYIKIINTKELTLSDSASELIRNYFVVSRRKRPHCLPLGAIKAITSLAEAHARLALRNEVLDEDVVAVIYLYEESISTLFGEPMNPYIKLNWNQEEPIFAFMGKQLQQFKVWLEQYIST